MIKKMSKKLIVILIISVIFGFFFITGCDPTPPASDIINDNTIDDSASDIPAVPQPENLVGTIAMDNGESAVMDLEFADSRILSRAAIEGITGKVRYMQVNYIAGGLYNNETGQLDIIAAIEGNSSGARFVISGYYSLTNGFSGTVTLYSSSDQTVIIAEGSVAAEAATDEEVDDIKIFTGTFGGSNTGTWNGTLTVDRFYGTWADYDDGRGTFSFSRNSDDLSDLIGTPQGLGLDGGGSISGSTLSGWWSVVWEEIVDDITYSGTSSGQWSGYEVDANYDSHVPTAADNSGFLSNLFYQAIVNGTTMYVGNADEDDYNISNLPDGGASSGDGHVIGPEVLGITVRSYGYWDISDYSLTVDYAVYTFTGYTDPQTGLTLDGEFYSKTTESPNTFSIVLDSDVDDNDGINNTGFQITFEDFTMLYVFADMSCSYTAESIYALNLPSAVFTFSSDNSYTTTANNSDLISSITNFLIP
jgi:hypothetical protein